MKGNWFLARNESCAHYDLMGLLRLVSLVRLLQCPPHENKLLPRPEAPLSPSGGCGKPPFQGLPINPHNIGSRLARATDDNVSLGLARLEDAQASQSWDRSTVLGKKTGKPCAP